MSEEGPNSSRIIADRAACAALVRDSDIDRYYSTLFAPADKRHALLTLYAFNAEIAQVRSRISEPLPGEVRLQWWRDVIAAGAQGKDDGELSGHPVAAALERIIRQYHLPRNALEAMIDARIFDLYDDPMPSRIDLEGYAGETSSALIRLASLILADGEDPGGADAAGHGGVGYAITGLLRSLGYHAARGQIFMPADMMAQHDVTRAAVRGGRAEPGLKPLLSEMRAMARHHLEQMSQNFADVPNVMIPALLPVMLCEGYLACMERADYNPFHSHVERAHLARLWTMWRAARRMRI